MSSTALSERKKARIPRIFPLPTDSRLLVVRGSVAPRHRNHYIELVLGHRGHFWVHRSPQGVRELVQQQLGKDPEILILDQKNGAGLLQVPESQVGEWVGRQGLVVGFLSAMLGVRVEVCGVPEKGT